MASTFSKSYAQLYVPFVKREDNDGKVWLQVQAHGALTAKTPYKVIVNEYGYITAALADDTTAHDYYVGVPAADVASGAIAWVQIGGFVDDMITPSITGVVGYGLKIYDGAVTLVSADYSGIAGEFAVITAASTTSTTQDVVLIPERITGQT